MRGVAEREPAIEIRDLVVRYGRRDAVNGLSLSVPRGSVYGFLGPNGAGKTTTIKTLLGFRGLDGGSARVLGHDVVGESLEVRARVGFASEVDSLYGGMTVDRICDFCRNLSRSWDQGLVDRYVGVFGLPRDTKIRKLSKGQRAQLQLCLALGSDPEVLILDEPTSGLDPMARHAFLKVLVGDVAAEGRTVFFSTHLLSDIEAAADTIGIIKGGRLLVSGDLDALRATHRVFRLAYAEAPPDEEVRALRDMPDVREVERMQREIESPDAAFLPPDLPPEMREQELAYVDDMREGMREQIEDMRTARYPVVMAGSEIRGFSMGANVVLVPLAGLLGVALVSGEVGRGTIFLLLSKPVSRRRTLLTKYSICAGVLFAAALVGSVASIISGYAHGYPAGSFSAAEILTSAGLFWLGSLFVLGVALLASVLFGDVIKSVIAAVAALYVIHSAPDLVRSFIQWLTWTDADYEQGFGMGDDWYETFERFRLINYWIAQDFRTGEFLLSLAAQNSLVCLVAAAVPLLLALWWFRSKAY